MGMSGDRSSKMVHKEKSRRGTRILESSRFQEHDMFYNPLPHQPIMPPFHHPETQQRDHPQVKRLSVPVGRPLLPSVETIGKPVKVREYSTRENLLRRQYQYESSREYYGSNSNLLEKAPILPPHPRASNINSRRISLPVQTLEEQFASKGHISQLPRKQSSYNHRLPQQQPRKRYSLLPDLSKIAPLSSVKQENWSHRGLSSTTMPSHHTLQHSNRRTQPSEQRDGNETTRYAPSSNNVNNNSDSKDVSVNGVHWPLTAGSAMKLFKDRLTTFEQAEILDYPEIYYLGLDAKKIEGVPGATMNNGYDDENGGYIRVLKDHLAYRYEVVDLVGKGSFGQVIKAYDHKTKEYIAIKIIRNKKRFHHQALVEVKILDSLRRKDRDKTYNIIHMKNYFYFRNHLCITFELLGMNLYELIKKNNFQGFNLSLVRR